MEPNKIANADILDILFEGRNKEYGAYDLRKTYNKRFTKSLLVTGVVILLLFLGSFLSNLRGAGKKQAYVIQDSVDLVELKEKKADPPIPPPPKPKPPVVAMIQSTPPRIVKDQDVKPDEVPPEQDKLDDTRIGAVNRDGFKDDGTETPPPSDGKGIVEAPKGTEEDDKPFLIVEIQSDFPGGSAAWLRYLNKNLRYPDEALNIGIEGAVVVQFIVDKEGNVSEVEAISGPEQGGLREEAVRVIKKSGKWTPAIQNGRSVKSYKKQPIIFRTAGQ
jgi:protein TonB